MLGPHPFSLFPNPRLGTPGIVVLPAAGFRRAASEITSWPGYAPTPLLDLPDLARQARLGALRLKDEAARFGLGSFKALGGAYAVANLLLAELARTGAAPKASTADLAAGQHRAATERITVTCATDGNHARAVARGVKLGRKPKLTPHQRKEILHRKENGEAVREIAHSYNVHNSTISRLAT